MVCIHLFASYCITGEISKHCDDSYRWPGPAFRWSCKFVTLLLLCKLTSVLKFEVEGKSMSLKVNVLSLMVTICPVVFLRLLVSSKCYLFPEVLFVSSKCSYTCVCSVFGLQIIELYVIIFILLRSGAHPGRLREGFFLSLYTHYFYLEQW